MGCSVAQATGTDRRSFEGGGLNALRKPPTGWGREKMRTSERRRAAE